MNHALESGRLIKSLIICFMLTGLSCVTSFAQPQRSMVTVIVAPDHADWTYKPGEKVVFSMRVIRDGIAQNKVKVNVQIGPEKMDPTLSKNLVLAEGQDTISGGTLSEPGFLRCVVTTTIDGKQYRGLATAGFIPYDIKPTTDLPKDFTEFWDKAKEDASKIPLDTKLTLLPDRCTEKVNVYQMNVQNYRYGSRIYGIVCIPKRPGKFPAELLVPGAGIRPYNGNISLAEKGVITVEIGIHGIPVTMETGIYNNLADGALNDYPSFNLDDRDHYYYKRVYMGCVRAIDFIYSLPEFDQKNLAVFGGSQGGALSVVTASLDDRVSYLVCMFPALSDLTGYLHNRAGGWPHMFDKRNAAYMATEKKIENSKYYDVVNFARFIKVPGMYTWGYNDEVCPPTTTFSVYNVIKAPKDLLLARETGHYTFPEQIEKLNNWLLGKINVYK